MAISPFSARPTSPGGEGRRARLAIALAVVGIVAIVLAYAVSPGVRHAVSHAEHSVKHAVSHVFDPDHARGGHRRARHRHVRLVAPLISHRHSRLAHSG